MTKRHAEQQIVVDAPPRDCFDALTAFESYPRWQRAIRAAEVISRDSRGRGHEVAFEADLGVRKVRYRLRYSYEQPHRIAWEYVEGDVREIDGEFILEDRGDGTTLATYSLALDPGVWLPTKLQRALNEKVMRGAMEDLKRHVERNRPAER